LRCLIVKEEITDAECMMVQEECYKKRPGKELEKRFKRIVGWNMICKNCEYHKKPKK